MIKKSLPFPKGDFQNWILFIRRKQLEILLGTEDENYNVTEFDIVMFKRVELLCELKYWRDRLNCPRYGKDPEYISSTKEGIAKQLEKIAEYINDCRLAAKKLAQKKRTRFMRILRDFEKVVNNGTYPRNLTKSIPVANLLIDFLSSEKWPNAQELRRALVYRRQDISSTSVDRVLDELGVKQCVPIVSGDDGTKIEKQEVRKKIELLGAVPPQKVSLSTLKVIYNQKLEAHQKASKEFEEIQKKWSEPERKESEAEIKEREEVWDDIAAHKSTE